MLRTRKPCIPGISHDRQQPCTGIFAAQGRKEAERAHTRVLHHIFRVSLALGQPSSVVEGSIDVRQDDLLKRLARHRLLNRPAPRVVYSRPASAPASE